MLMTLSQGQANRNKFYQLELWTKPGVRRVYLVARWGRIGAKGQTQCKSLATLEQAMSPSASESNEGRNSWDAPAVV